MKCFLPPSPFPMQANKLVPWCGHVTYVRTLWTTGPKVNQITERLKHGHPTLVMDDKKFCPFLCLSVCLSSSEMEFEYLWREGIYLLLIEQATD